MKNIIRISGIIFLIPIVILINSCEEKPIPPELTTSAATSITSTSVTLNGTVNANNQTIKVTFEYGTTTSYGQSITAIPETVSGSINTSVYANLTGLSTNTTYHFRVKAVSSDGTTNGSDMTFTIVYVIGENVNGGLVFYIDGTGLHGLVCAPYDVGYAAWGCHGTTITGADGTAVGTGNQNTIDLINGCSDEGIAARICCDLDLNGYTDWFLPSKDELGLMYTNLKFNGFGNFSDQFYWSSSEYSNIYAWHSVLLDGLPRIHYKLTTMYVRAVRSF